jgi:carbamoyltransferase
MRLRRSSQVPFERAAVLCLDGVGEWATTSAWVGQGNSITPLWEIRFPHSLGLLYSAFTYYAGFRVNSGEYNLMDLAPYGEPKYPDLIMRKLLDVKTDGTFRMAKRYFNYCTGFTMTNARFDELFGGHRRRPESPITQREMDIAASIQRVTDETILRLARTLHRETDERHLCLAGGVALNCVATAASCVKALSKTCGFNRLQATQAVRSARRNSLGTSMRVNLVSPTVATECTVDI